VSLHQLVQLARAQFRPTGATPNRNEQLGLYKNCVIMAAHNAPQSRAPMPQLFGRFIGKTCMNGGVVKPHLIEVTDGYE
jgi:hypothetical protein